MLYWLQRVEILTYIVVSDGKEFKGKGRKNNKTNQPNKKTIMWNELNVKRRAINETWKIMG